MFAHLGWPHSACLGHTLCAWATRAVIAVAGPLVARPPGPPLAPLGWLVATMPRPPTASLPRRWVGLVPLAPTLGRVCALCSGLPRIIRLGRTGADWAAMQLGRFVDAGLFKL